MGSKNKSELSSELFPGVEKKGNWALLSQHEINHIWEVFTKEHDNSIRRISDITGFTPYIINRVYEEKTGTRGVKQADMDRYRHVFAESKYASKQKLAQYFYNQPNYRHKYQGVDVDYYVQAVLNWSEMNPKIKRTDRGWCATIRKFIESDRVKKKMVMKVAEIKSRRNF